MSATGTLITVGTIAGIYAILALALNIKFGETGILDFGHVAFYLVGAYMAALLVMPVPGSFAFQDYLFGLDLHMRFIEFTGIEIFGAVGWAVAMAIAILAAAFLGLIVALPTIRLRADYLAIALLGVSVIAVRVVQTETWLANGPDALRGYPRPFQELIPLPGSSPSAAFLLAMVVVLIWGMLLFMLARANLVDELSGWRGRAIELGLWVASFGAGYWAVKRTRRGRADEEGGIRAQTNPRAYASVFGVIFAFGVVAAVAAVMGFGAEVILLFLGGGSLLVWFVLGLKIREHYREYNWQSGLAGLVLAVGLLATLAPTNVLLNAEGILPQVGALLTFGLMAAYGYGLYLGYRRWDQIDVPGDYMGIVGIAVLWLVGIRYFVQPVARSSTLDSMIQSTQENIFWLVDFDATLGPSLDYRRFLFIMVIAAVMASYFLLEMLRQSPYGRVLRAIRDDENVAMSLGKNTFYYKVQAMVIGGAFAGLAGALAAIHFRSLGFTLFNPVITFFIFLAVILGGKGNNRGVILGAAFYWIFVRGTSELAGMFPPGIGGRLVILRNAIIGLLLIFVLYYKPEGIWPEQPTVVEVPK